MTEDLSPSCSSDLEVVVDFGAPVNLENSHNQSEKEKKRDKGDFSPSICSASSGQTFLK
jgi:hypothetical protein